MTRLVFRTRSRLRHSLAVTATVTGVALCLSSGLLAGAEMRLPHCGLVLDLPDDMQPRGATTEHTWARRGASPAAVSVVCDFEGPGTRLVEFQARTESVLKRRGYSPVSGGERNFVGMSCAARVLSREDQPSRSHAVALYAALPPGEQRLTALVLVEAPDAAAAEALAQAVWNGARFEAGLFRPPPGVPSAVTKSLAVVAADGKARAAFFDAAGKLVVWRGVPVTVEMAQRTGDGRSASRVLRTVYDSRDLSLLGGGLWAVSASTRLEFRAGEATLPSTTVTMPP